MVLFVHDLLSYDFRRKNFLVPSQDHRKTGATLSNPSFHRAIVFYRYNYTKKALKTDYRMNLDYRIKHTCNPLRLQDRNSESLSLFDHQLEHESNIGNLNYSHMYLDVAVKKIVQMIL